MGKRKNAIKPSAAENYLLGVESQFKKVSDIKEDISIYPLLQHLDTSVETNKDKSKEFGEVFTPLWLVDEMVGQVKHLDANTTTLDLCAGYGQFSIRLLRKLYNKDPIKFDPVHYIKHNHSFSELQLSSCYKLIRIFGMNINLFIGDSKELPSLPGVARGIWVYLESMKGWVPFTHTIRKTLIPSGDTKDVVKEEKFIELLQDTIDQLNKGYEIMSVYRHKNCSPETELMFLKLLNEDLNDLHPEDESVWTPTGIVHDICKTISDKEAKKILVLFNAEIVSELVRAKKIKPDQITFGVDDANKARAVFVSKTFDVPTCVFADKSPKSLLEALGNKKWDVVLTNPPYNDGLDLKIVQALMDHSVAKEYIIVHPSGYLIDLKGKKELYTTFKDTLAGKLRSVKLFNGNPLFNIDLFLPCAITHIDTNYESNTIEVNYFGKTFQVSSVEDITKFGVEWKHIVKPFFNNIQHYIELHGNVWSHILKNAMITNDQLCCQLANIIGNHSKDRNVLLKDDFYTMTIRNSEDNKGIRDDKMSKPTFQFKSEIERDNFLAYLNTDFARFCLSLYKINANLHRGELEIIPWMDFTETWDDEKLFTHFNIDQQTQDYIRSFLPDYYGIRNVGMKQVDAAIEVLRRNNNDPLSSKEIWERIEKDGLARSDGKTPEATISTMLGVRSKNSSYSTKSIANNNPKGEIIFENIGGKFKLIDDIYTTTQHSQAE
jgi:hypothetical protein